MTAIVAAAKARGVPIVSAEQMLDWLDGRNGSSFGNLSFADRRLQFTVARAAGSRGLVGMVPAAALGGFTGLTRDGAPVAVEQRIVKGIPYAVFPAEAGQYVAGYAPVAGPPAAPGGQPSATPDRTRPRVTVKKRKVRVTRKGAVKLRIACPKTEVRCRIDVKLRTAKGKAIASKRLTVAGGKGGTVALQLSRKLRTRLARAGSLKVKTVLRVRDAAGNTRTQRLGITLLAPRRKLTQPGRWRAARPRAAASSSGPTAAGTSPGP